MSAPIDRLKGTCLDLSLFPDRYAHAGEADPKVLLTTSRDPSSRLVQFAKASGEAPGAVCIHTFVPRMHTCLYHAGKQAPVVA